MADSRDEDRRWFPWAATHWLALVALVGLVDGHADADRSVARATITALSGSVNLSSHQELRPPLAGTVAVYGCVLGLNDDLVVLGERAGQALIDSDGAFRVPGPLPPACLVRVEVVGHAPAWAIAIVDESMNCHVDVPLVSGRLVAVQVSSMGDLKGSESVLLVSESRHLDPRAKNQVYAPGLSAPRLESDRVKPRVHAAHVTERFPCDAEGQARVTIPRAGCFIAAYWPGVNRASMWSPVAGAMLEREIISFAPRAFPRVRVRTTLEGGSGQVEVTGNGARLPAVAPGKWVELEARPYATCEFIVSSRGHEAKSVAVDVGERDEQVDVVLRREATVSGLIIAGSDGLPVEGAAVTGPAGTAASVSTGGRFQLERMPHGRATIDVRAEGFLPKRVQLTAPTQRLVVQLKREARLLAVVRGERGGAGDPVRLMLRIGENHYREMSVSSSAEGTPVDWRELPEGRFELRIAHAGRERSWGGELREGQTTDLGLLPW